jgi:hypothetical protein
MVSIKYDYRLSQAGKATMRLVGASPAACQLASR